MILTLVNVLYVLIAVAMTTLILLQRGAGAAAGSGFGAGASATVFGARGASNFLSKSTAILAALFFALSLGMAYNASRGAAGASSDDVDLGVMGGVVPAPATGDAPVTPAPAASAVPAPADAPAAPAATSTPAAVPAESDAAPQDDKGN